MPETQPASEFDSLPLIPETATRYEVLGLERAASAEEIRVAYRRLALLYHPDRHPEADRERAAEVFKRVSAAYHTLSNRSERQRYDTALDRGEHFHEAAGGETTVNLSDILAGIDVYEHIFSAAPMQGMDATLREIVMPRLMNEIHEQIVAVWKMPEAPVGATYQGTYSAGAVVLTNLRVLLPFTYSWEETRGNTKYRYKGAGMPQCVLPLVQGITFLSRGRVRNKLMVEIRSEQESIRFRPGHSNLGKLLLVARLWGIAVDARQEEAKADEWKWALLNPWKWALGTLASAMVLAAVGAVFGGGFLDNPIDLANFMSRNGLWQWYAVFWAAISARRVWRCVIAYDPATPIPADGLPSEAGLQAGLETHSTAS